MGVPQPMLSQPVVLRAVTLSGGYLCLIGLTGLGLGAIARRAATAIAALGILVFVVPLAGLAATPAGKFLPELIYANSLGATKPVAGFTLSPWAGFGIICGYAAVVLAAGGWAAHPPGRLTQPGGRAGLRPARGPARSRLAVVTHVDVQAEPPEGLGTFAVS